ncbi:DNA polymerase IV [Suttonella ornithocola]|uniref:DNA polymerase IV n=1 Tax=Suttonella ornithocola TaxID=279832 RepID=A0A380MSU4_9GAMM|nr:DNA polymerase IV [Suttonella ornithocola]SUO95689.1 DNA polymerase IV [Suttonella ornithocola]
MIKKIIHIDMDAYYAAIEQRDNPSLRGKPVIVGGNPKRRGVVATCSYEARKYGVRSAMSTAYALRLCPQAIVIPPRFEVYRQISEDIRQLFYAVTPLVEPLSLDEAYLDVSESTYQKGSATLIAKALKRDIFQLTGLTASAGVSYNKMLAKIASDVNKPNGIHIILPEQAEAFIAALPIEKIHGIGKSTALKMHGLGIGTGKELRAAGEKLLIQHFGKKGLFYYQVACGIDLRAVKSKRIRKSIGSEITFAYDLKDDKDIIEALFLQNYKAFSLLAQRNCYAKTVTIKVKYSDFSQITRSHSVSPYFLHEDSAKEWITRLYKDSPRQLPVRLVGVSYSGLIESFKQSQPSLF